MASRFHTVNFGQAYASLSTVGYALYNQLGVILTARSQATVVEIGTATGVYGAVIDVNEEIGTVILWDTGGGSPRYASETSQTQLSQIQYETDHIRLIWNSLRNQGEFYTRLLDKVDKLKSIVEGLGEVVLGIDKKPELTLSDIKSALNVTVNAPTIPSPIIKMGDLSIPDHTQQISAIKTMMIDLKGLVMAIPKNQKDYKGNFDNVIALLGATEKRLNDSLGEKSKGIISSLKELEKTFNKIDNVFSKINDLQLRLKDLDGNDKEIMKTRNDIAKEMSRLNIFLTDFLHSPVMKEAREGVNLAMAFGHKVRK